MIFKPARRLNGNLIYLEQKTPSFELATTFFNLLKNNEKHLKYWFQVVDIPMFQDETETFCYLYQLYSNNQKQPSFSYFIYTPDNQLIGFLYAFSTQPQNAGLTIQFWMDKSKTRHGFMSEALRLIEKEFFFAGIERLTICCPIENTKARNLAIKSGYLLEGTAHHIYWNAFDKTFDDLSVFAKVHGKNSCPV